MVQLAKMVSPKTVVKSVPSPPPSPTLKRQNATCEGIPDKPVKAPSGPPHSPPAHPAPAVWPFV